MICIDADNNKPVFLQRVIKHLCWTEL